MKNLMILTADMMSYDMLIEALFDNLLEYRTSESKEKMLDQIEIGCHMICLKSSIDKVGGIENFNKRMDDLERKDNFFKPSQQ
jgi:hypothetical protein